jgi:hypothetical protein
VWQNGAEIDFQLVRRFKFKIVCGGGGDLSELLVIVIS